ncbi:MAG: HAMP domain-containing protein [Burkholderiales bacterium]|nr:HAMP domain-containing protein [Burkholderiales bacterium]
MACVVLLLVMTVAISGKRGADTMTQQNMVTSQRIAQISETARWAGLTETNVARLMASLVSTDPAIDALYKEQIPAGIAEMTRIRKTIEAMNLSAPSRDILAQIGEQGQAVLASSAKAQAARAAGDQAAVAKELVDTFLPAAARYSKSLQALADLQMQEMESVRVEFAEQREANLNFARGMVLLLVVLLIAGAYFLIKEIQKPLLDAIGVAEAIGGGDLTVQIDTSRGDEFGQMMRAITNMQQQLVRLVSDVRHGTDGLANVSEEIAAGNNDLSTRTEQTAANLEETASSMQELTSNVRQSADSAKQANQLAASAAQVAQRGGEVVGQVVSTMDEINASSRKISDIISVIDGIAFQTNILALNAAVEAARAGEQGRGFAVVASEVRSLAGRSADAAKEIKLLINTSVEKVEGGAALVSQAGDTMTEIVSSVQRVTDIMGEITAAASEQSDGIAQINAAIGQLDQMTQQNAALVEQSAAAASSMKDQSYRLAGVVATFKLDASAAAALPKASSPRPSLPRPAAPRKALAAPPKTLPKAAPVVTAKAAPRTAPAAKADEEWETF